MRYGNYYFAPPRIYLLLLAYLLAWKRDTREGVFSRKSYCCFPVSVW